MDQLHNNGEFLTNSEKLIAFLDGELSGPDAEQLFFDMAQNPELQSEMREHVLIKNMYKGSMSQPPAALKQNILMSTGLASGGTTDTPAGGSSGSQGGFFAGKPFIAGMSALLAFLGAYLIFNTADDNLQAELASKDLEPLIQSFEDKSSDRPEINYTEPASLTTAAPSEISQSLSAGTNKAANKAQASLNNPKTEKANDNVSLQPGMPVIQPEIAMLTYSNSRREQLSINTVERPQPNMPIEYRNYGQYIRNFSLQFRYNFTNPINGNDVAPLSEPTINNMGISLAYQFDENNSLGVEVGQENFMMNYSGKVDNIFVDENINYLGFWGGLYYQYDFGSVAEFDIVNLQPFARILVGGTEVGPLIRPMIGAELIRTGKISVYGALEYTRLWYFFSGNTFNSDKAGLTAGIRVNL
ncbi:MAG: hypothetical protein ACLFQU_02390 [Candidatus Kapaibacterium sp.]